jgi:hypothetical protein
MEMTEKQNLQVILLNKGTVELNPMVIKWNINTVPISILICSCVFNDKVLTNLGERDRPKTSLAISVLQKLKLFFPCTCETALKSSFSFFFLKNRNIVKQECSGNYRGEIHQC